MKIGILSMQRIVNYGSFLQAYCLKQTLESMGHKVIFVDFKSGPVLAKDWWKNIWPFSVYRRSRALKSAPKYKEEPYFSEAYSKLGLQNKMVYKEDIDALIIGSDEIFNYIQQNPLVGYAPSMLGLHIKSPIKITYAASCGSLSKERIEKWHKGSDLKKALKSYDAVSVRDEKTAHLIGQYGYDSYEYHLDPVLIGNAENEIIDTVTEKDYILLYGYPGRFTDEEGKVIQQFAHSREKKLISFCGMQKFCDDYLACSPFEILAYFKHADYIITDTFHGTIFSIIMHRQFVTVCRKTDNASTDNSGKLLDLLKRLRVQNREVTDVASIAEMIDKPIDFDRIEAIREQERKKSLQYLADNLKK